MAASDWEIPPPANVAVEAGHKLVLYTPDGSALVRSAGFTKTGQTAMQTSSTYPQLNTGKKGGKKKGGRGC